MATLSVQQADRAANAVTLAAASAGGDEFVNTGKEALLIDNGGGSPITVTFATPVTVDGLAVDDLDIDVPDGEMHLLGPFPTGTYNDGDGKVQISYTDVTSVTVAAIRI